jgi:DNA-binding MarR family transcriptional regulator
MIKNLIIIIMSIGPRKSPANHPRVDPEPEASASRPNPGIFRIGVDGLPLPRVAAPLARRLQQICASLIAEALEGSGFVQLEFATMRFIADMPGIEQWKVADAIGIDRNSASLISDRLERQGLIVRRVNSNDRRARELYFTRKGMQAFETLLPKIREANERILSPLAEHERALLIDLLAKLVEGNAIHARPGAGRRKRGGDKDS